MDIKETVGVTVDIKKFAVHDGPGIRTTLFMKGCPLHCLWCHNPESISREAQVGYIAKKCIGCGECVKVCPSGAHKVTAEGRTYDRKSCIGCGRCADACLGEALIFYGKKCTPSQVIDALLEDKDFYESSGGGVTVSGGEPLIQSEFCEELLKLLKQNNIHTAIDTCGFVSREAIDRVFPYTDMFLYDIKGFFTELHKKCTGHGNERILENLRYLDEKGANVEIRMPLVPGYNDDDETLEEERKLLSSLKCVKKVRVLPYHSLAGSKYDSLEMENTLPKVEPPSKERTEELEKLFNASLCKE